MSNRTAATLAILLCSWVCTLMVAGVGVVTVHRGSAEFVRSRADENLAVVARAYEARMRRMLRSLEDRARAVEPDANDIRPIVAQIKADLGLDVLNVCNPAGVPVVGSHDTKGRAVPVSSDTVLRQAVKGKPAWATVVMDKDRLEMEGGAVLGNALAMRFGFGPSGVSHSLFSWFAVPIQDDAGQVVALLYGGRGFNGDVGLVDDLRSLVVGEPVRDDRPAGTVSLFLGDVRVATNVLGPGGSRMIGTRASLEAHQNVLEKARRWARSERQFDADYLVDYEPLKDADGRVVGMISVALLQAPYDAVAARLTLRLLWPVGLLLIASLLAARLMARRLARPIESLAGAADEAVRTRWQKPIGEIEGSREVARVVDAFRNVQTVLAERQRHRRVPEGRDVDDASAGPDRGQPGE